MVALSKPAPGGDFGTWGTKVNAALDAINERVEQAHALADTATTPTEAGLLATQARDAAIAASEAKISRTGATTGYIVTLDAAGKLVFTQPAGVTLPDASPTAKGIVQLTADLGGTALAPTTPTAVHKTGAETVDGVKTFNAKPVVPDASFPLSKLILTGTPTATSVVGSGGAHVEVSAGTAAPTFISFSGDRIIAGTENGAIFVATGPGRLLVPTGLPAGFTFSVIREGAGPVSVVAATVNTATPTVRAARATLRNGALAANYTYTVDLPPEALAGDLLWLATSSPDDTATHVLPAGWTWQAATSGGPVGTHGQVYTLPNISQAQADAASFDFTVQTATGSGAARAFVVAAISGAHPTDPVVQKADSGATQSGITPAITATTAGCLELGMVHGSNATFVDPAYGTPANATMVLSAATSGATPSTRTAVVRRAALTTVGGVTGGFDFGGNYGGTQTHLIRPSTQAGVTILEQDNIFTVEKVNGYRTCLRLGSPDRFLLV